MSIWRRRGVLERPCVRTGSRRWERLVAAMAALATGALRNSFLRKSPALPCPAVAARFTRRRHLKRGSRSAPPPPRDVAESCQSTRVCSIFCFLLCNVFIVVAPPVDNARVYLPVTRHRASYVAPVFWRETCLQPGVIVCRPCLVAPVARAGVRLPLSLQRR